jgi:hypothetical protein
MLPNWADSTGKLPISGDFNGMLSLLEDCSIMLSI